MKKLIFLALLNLGTYVSLQAQDFSTSADQQFSVVVTNNSTGSWAYKLYDSKTGVVVNRYFAPGETATFTAPTYGFPMQWGAQDPSMCTVNGTFDSSTSNSSNTTAGDTSGSSSKLSTCAGGTIAQRFVQGTNGNLTLYVNMN